LNSGDAVTAPRPRDCTDHHLAGYFAAGLLDRRGEIDELVRAVGRAVLNVDVDAIDKNHAHVAVFRRAGGCDREFPSDRQQFLQRFLGHCEIELHANLCALLDKCLGVRGPRKSCTGDEAKSDGDALVARMVPPGCRGRWR
jgi:hypothetical protein